ncbi:MAG: hypothetical protein ACLS61_15915 [Ruminococcus sp.]
MADDTIYNFIQNYIDGKISRAAFWELAKFSHSDTPDQFSYNLCIRYAKICGK